MYWREYYSDVDAALRDEHLAGLGKVKLTTAQKAAIQQAKADAKVSKITAKAGVTSARLAAKSASIANKQAVRAARATAKINKYASQNIPATSSAFDSPSTALIPAMSESFAPAMNPSGGGSALAPAAPSGSEAEAAAAGDSTVLWIAGAGALLLLFLFMKR